MNNLLFFFKTEFNIINPIVQTPNTFNLNFHRTIDVPVTAEHCNKNNEE